MGGNKKDNKMSLKGVLKEAWDLGRKKKFTHLINCGFAGGMAFVYFESFIFAFGNKAVDTELTHAVIMIKIILVGFVVLRGLTYVVERLSKSDELDQLIRTDALQIAHVFLIATIIGSLLSWSLHENTTTVFHLIFVSLAVSYALFHFISSIKYMNFMAKPSLFELDSQE